MTFEKKEFGIYYRINPTFREDGFPRTQAQLERKYRFVKTVEAESKEQAFEMMQADRWSPNGEARDLIKNLRLHHTSMSVGDLIKEDNKHYVVQDIGFKWIPVTPNRVMRKVLGISTSRDITREGHPSAYWYILECGHIALESHKAKSAIEYGLVKEVPVMRNCTYCQRNKPVDKEVTLAVLGFFRARELSDDLIALYKKVRES